MVQTNNSFEQQKHLIARCEDWIRQSEKTRQTSFSFFLDESQLTFIEKYCGKKIKIRKDGGYPEAKRNRVAFLYEDEFESEVICLLTRVNQKFVKITHRDILGSLMALDLDRNQFGDFFVLDDHVIVYCTKQIAMVVVEQCRQIHKTPVQFEISNLVYAPIQEFETISINIASFRLDNLVSSLVPCGRSEASKKIESGHVKVNHEMIEDSKKMCHNNDTISISKVGRFQIMENVKITRKDRFVVDVKKFL